MHHLCHYLLLLRCVVTGDLRRAPGFVTRGWNVFAEQRCFKDQSEIVGQGWAAGPLEGERELGVTRAGSVPAGGTGILYRGEQRGPRRMLPSGHLMRL